MKRLSLAFVAAVLLTGCRQAEPVETLHLDNGLTVLLRPVAGADQAALVVLHRMGGRHDPPGQSGLAHLLEHCYVTAQAGRTPQRTMEQYVACYPDGWNAQTGDDYTVFGCVFPAERLEDELRDAASRLGDLRVAKTDVSRERPRILVELRNMYGGMPQLAAVNIARERVSPTPTGGRKGGLPDEVAALTAADLQQRWARYYRANNATLILVGGFDADTVRQRVAYYFQTLPRGKDAPPAPESAAPKLPVSETLEVVPTQPAAPVACLAFAAPTPESDLYAPFLVIVARLWQSAASPSGPLKPIVYCAPLDDPKVLALSAAVEGLPPDQAFAALRNILASALAREFSSADVAVARNAFGWMLGLGDVPDAAIRQNLYGTALSLGRRAQLGIDPDRLARALESVTADDVRRAAQTLFAEDKCAAVYVNPAPPTPETSD
jgi:zinc protease